MSAHVELTAEIVRELLDYDPDTGVLIWRVRDVKWFTDGGHSAAHSCNKWNGKFSGKVARAFFMRTGHQQVSIFKRRYLSHRIAWLHYYGYWPYKHIDHINHDARDNRIVNLRDVSNAENHKNKAMLKRNSSGVTGVGWHKQTNSWRARIGVGFRSKHLGLFANFNDAVTARKKAERDHCFHTNHGSKTI